MKTFITTTEKETFALAKKFARSLKGNEAIALTGELGSGKTVFIKGIAKSLDIKEHIISPTFNIMKIYNIPYSMFHLRHHKLCHIDAYRLNSSEDLTSLGITNYLSDDKTITIIEWAEKVKNLLPRNTIYINFKVNKSKRAITVSQKI
ncbi:tRNA (adenosine(37)-N6)-threonylcarbamoyltransferase complex ATPase subunit type 1 TsaE [Candidatus Falkowbacteria bacterium]|jgi:tRNA threonylcarbamoyladenosine biosynthesis protein TsaE|nr:tRNA (adenosine(37)-N6)-threonylcarbamoyltransferase complex ATPase subunit type 1 TsaE [Candidatus Falkowbacteria bacterium]MBT4432780.1 tRNA (adenosine(37)-N6)-threonylcarbamoyltransferase complex ATPase subunit type 1 TsaE [Candidatus Falkowbacteria bacterium]